MARAAVLATLAVSALARAEPEAAGPGPGVASAPAVAPSSVVASAPVERWYGAPMLAVDGVAAALVATGWIAEKSDAAAAGYGIYAFGGPIVHLGHGQGLNVARSLGIRLFPLLIGYAVASNLGESERVKDPEGDEQAGAIAVGFLTAGALAAALIDDLVIARVTRDGAAGPGAAGRPPSERGAAWAPQVSPLPGGGWSVGAAGGW